MFEQGKIDIKGVIEIPDSSGLGREIDRDELGNLTDSL